MFKSTICDFVHLGKEERWVFMLSWHNHIIFDLARSCQPTRSPMESLAMRNSTRAFSSLVQVKVPICHELWKRGLSCCSLLVLGAIVHHIEEAIYPTFASRICFPSSHALRLSLAGYASIVQSFKLWYWRYKPVHPVSMLLNPLNAEFSYNMTNETSRTCLRNLCGSWLTEISRQPSFCDFFAHLVMPVSQVP